MSVMDINVTIDGEPMLVTQTEDQPREGLERAVALFMALLLVGITDDTDTAPLGVE